MLSLPTQLNVPKTNLGDYIILIVGRKKAGKTSLASMFPNSFILECAPGNADHLKVRKSDIHSWEELTGYVELLEKNPSYAQTITIDELDQAYYYCYQYVRGLYKKADTEKDDFDVWRTTKNLFTTFIKRLVALKKGIIFTTHITVKEYTDKAGNIIASQESALSKQYADIMDCLVTCWFIMEFTDNGERELILEGDDFIKAGHGFTDHFINPVDASRLKKIPLGKNPMQAYGNLIMAFNNKLQVVSSSKR